MKNCKNMGIFIFHKVSNFEPFNLDHFIKHQPLNSEECNVFMWVEIRTRQI